MDALVESLSSVDVTPHPNNPNAEHPRYSLYKSKASRSSQEERRKAILEARKESRYDLMSHMRNLEEGSKDFLDEENGDTMDCEENPKAVYGRPREYRNFAMLSEWLVDVPDNFAQTYLALPCPVGKRTIVVCYKGWTSAYAKNGKRIRSFPSLLPGGSNKTKRQGHTILDCIWSEAENTFYIIDLIFWCKQSMLECDTVFRFEWLKSRLSEWEENISIISKQNSYRFVPLSYHSCFDASLYQMLFDELPFKVDLDGILFYHKESHYTHGASPLICWLKAFMLPEMLGVQIPDKYLKERPPHYIDISTHIVEYDKERKELQEKRAVELKSKKNKSEKMETCLELS